MNKLAYGVLLAVIAAAGCSHGSVADTVVVPDTVTLSRQGGALPPLERTVSDRSIVEPLYASIFALPSIPPGAIQHCPMDRGIKVQLKFLQTGKTVLEASASTGGCRDVVLTDGRVFSASGPAGSPFWSLMAKAAGVSESDLAGY